MERADSDSAGRRDAAPAPDDGELSPASAQGSADGSLASDIEALLADGRTYFEAELSYQKSRVAFSGSRIKWALVYGAAAFGFLHLALIALVVGVVIALAPVVGPWASIALVTLLLLAGAAVFIRRLRAKLREVRQVFDEGRL